MNKRRAVKYVAVGAGLLLGALVTLVAVVVDGVIQAEKSGRYA